MSDSVVTHERLMNRSRTILPRVGGGVGGGGGGGFGGLPSQVQNLTFGADRLAQFGLGAAR
jgi:hypothetical protein